MAILIGFLIGGGLGLLTGESGAALGGALIGALVGLIVRVLRKRAPAPAAAPDAELVRRVALLEARVQGLEMALLRVLGEAPPEAARGAYDQPAAPMKYEFKGTLKGNRVFTVKVSAKARWTKVTKIKATLTVRSGSVVERRRVTIRR